MAGTIKVALIGAGRTGSPLLKEMLKYKYIKVVGVSDKNEKAAGFKLAKKKKIFTTTDVMKLLKKSKSIDILIDVTGDVVQKRKIKSILAKQKNIRTLIMHDLIARLFISVSTRKARLIPGFHPKDVGIGK